MRTLITSIFLAIGLIGSAQNIIWSHAIGNWRNGPVVYITPLIETTEAFTTPQLIAHYRTEFPELKNVVDLDVLRFGTPEEGNDSRNTLKAKYGMRKLEVVMLETPKTVDKKAE
ncbi:MAG TPA: hypothetical protein PL070_11085 [Flavobacteriales bacterium]|nr:hypothetical protein [Flavobacteriales bacterium]